MRIGIEAQRLFRKRKHGMDYVVLEEIKELQNMNTRHEFFVFVAPGDDRCIKESSNLHVIEFGSSFYPLWEQYTLPKIAKKYNLDILHCTSNTAPIICKIPIVLTLHDIIFLEPKNDCNKSLYQNMGWHYRKIIVPKIIGKCKKIITVSHQEKKNIMQTLNIPKEKVCMIHNAYDSCYRPISDYKQIVDKYIHTEKYFFHFANTDPRKNTERTLFAYANYLSRSDYKRQLLVTGINKKQLTSILKDNNIESINGKIVLTDYIPSEDLPYIYNGAFSLIFASLREGFGIPILEAMACGIPVITSNISSMPEVAGEDAIQINPYNSDEIADKMLLLENDENFYLKQKEIGLSRSKLFSWKRTTEQLLEIYEDVYKSCINEE